MKSGKFKKITAMTLILCLLFVSSAGAQENRIKTEESAADEALLTESDEFDEIAFDVVQEIELTDEDDEITYEAFDMTEDGALSTTVLDTNADYSLIVGTHDKYMSGYPDGTFRPDNNLTRAEFSVILYAMLDNPPSPVVGQFTDVNDTGWYAEAVNSLAAVGILKGDGDGTFRPNDGITRAETVTVLALLTETSLEGSISFSDVDVTHWAYEHIVTAAVASWVSGYTDGTFQPNSTIKRSEITIIMNQILERHDDDFGADAEEEDKLFFDVASSHWAFMDIMEAGQRVENPITNETKYISTIAAVNFREEPSTSANIIATLPINTVLTVIDDTSYGDWIKASHASYGTGYVHSDYVTSSSGVDGGTNSGDGVISTTAASIPQYKTLYISGSSGTWTSDNPSIAGVFTKSGDTTKAFVYANAVGTTYIRLRDSSGNIKSTCTVTVTAAEVVRFAYADPNTPSAGVKFNMYAVTDTGKSDVRFVVTGPASGTYESSTYTVETKSASSSSSVVPANSVRIFQREVTFNVAGEYTVKVYSKTSGGTWSTSYKSFDLLVVSDKDQFTTSTAKRSASNDIISVIAGFEGTGSEPGEVYIDTLSSGLVPTVGYGYVPAKNSTFYNNLTETEMLAMLADTINNGNYVKDLRTFQSTYNVKMSQVQFDAMVSFGYNLGTGYFKDGSSNTFNIFLNAMTFPSLSASAAINAGTATLYNQASTSGSTNGTVPSGASVTVTEIQLNTGDVNNLWYKITYSGKTGWIRGGYARFTTTTTRDLQYIDEQLFGSNLLQWNSAGGTRLPGLVYRRLGEAKIFCYGNYADAYSSSANYRKNVGFDPPTDVPGLNLT